MPEDVNPQSSDYQFGKILTKLESIEDTMATRHREVISRLDVQDAKISSLEKWKARATGAFAVGIGAGSALLAWLESVK
jgi:hypothetical protein